MCQNVFGYNPNQPKAQETKVKHVKFNTGFVSQPDFGDSGFSNQGNLPVLVLDDVPIFMRVT